MKIFRSNIFKIVLALVILTVLLGILPGCQKILYIPGASYGYYIWEEEEKIHISWSVDRKDTAFSGSISVDGELIDYELVDWEDTDYFGISGTSISFTSTLGTEDYSDGIILEIEDYDLIEFDLLINDGYDLSRIHVGAFLENPSASPFQVDKGYFEDVRVKPWYEKHPFSGFFYKLFSNKYFTFVYLFILGAVVIEIIRITAFSAKKRKGPYIGISYIILIALEILSYFILRFFVL